MQPSKQQPAVGTTALVRGASTAAAMLLPGRGKANRFVRSAVVAGGYLASEQLGEKGRPQFLVMSFEDSDNVPEPVRRYGNLALGTASWLGIQALLGHAAALLPLPKLVKAVGLGALVAVADQKMSDRAGRAQVARSTNGAAAPTGL